MKKYWLCLAFIASSSLGISCAQAYTIDGNLSDWGLHHNGNASDWTPNSTVKKYTVEDQTGGLNTYLNPGYGGQRYDAEAMYVSWDSTKLYIALSTGMPKNNPHNPSGNTFGPGDFAIDFGRNGSFDYGVVTTALSGKVIGGLYKNITWEHGVFPNPNPAVVAVGSGTLVTTGEFVYSDAATQNMGQWIADDHYTLEYSVPLIAFGDDWGQPFDLQWAARCANDIINVSVPEPGTLLLLSLGGGLLWSGRRKHRHNA